MNLASGQCDPDALTEEELIACVVSDSPGATHPPLNVRADIIVRIIENGEDLTGFLALLPTLSP